MPRSILLLLLAVVSTFLIIAAFDNNPQSQSRAQATEPDHNTHDAHHGNAHGDEHAAAHAGAWKSVDRAVAVLSPTAGSTVYGVLHFVESEGKVQITGEVRGLEPHQTHAMHAHQWGDISSADGSAAGGHYNPAGHPHGLPNGDERHAGDFGNIQADENGLAQVDLTVDNITIAGIKNPIIGRGLIVHAQADDGGQPTGNAGGRIAQGVIGIANPEAPQ
jgi:Cu-Zn family superoxide dismutase